MLKSAVLTCTRKQLGNNVLSLNGLIWLTKLFCRSEILIAQVRNYMR